MGYRDDFYIAENIVGYSGSLHINPTVYFISNDGGSRTFGRITQDHGNKLNVGRNATRSHDDYVVENRTVRGAEKCIEFYGGKIRHESRSLFTPFNGLSALQKSVLKRAIINYPEAKGKIGASAQAMLAERMNPRREARGSVEEDNTWDLLCFHEEAIEDAKI